MTNERLAEIEQEIIDRNLYVEDSRSYQLLYELIREIKDQNETIASFKAEEYNRQMSDNSR